MITFQMCLSNKKNKKYQVILYKFRKDKNITFGDSRYNDFIEYD